MEKKIGQQSVNEEISDEEASSSKINFVWVAMALLLCLHAGLYWLWFQQKTVNRQLEQQIVAAIPPVVETSAFEQSLETMDKKVQQQVNTLLDEQKLLAENVTTLSDSQQMSKGDVEYYWAMAELTYLLNVANQQVLLVGDVAGAQEALALAESRIEGLNDYRLHPLRALIIEEKLALSAVNKVDIEGMSLQLESAIQGVDKLQVLMSVPVNAINPQQIEENSDWRGAMDQAWKEVKSLVVIRHQQEGAAEVLVPEQRYFLYQNLRLKLETARFALLAGKENVFSESLSSAEQWLNDYFVGDERDAILALVTELNSDSIEMKMPDISASLAWLRGFEQ